MNKINFYPLKHIEDERGSVMHFVKNTDEFFKKFGECYFSWVNPGVVKGWYNSEKHTSLMTCPTANLQIVLYDDIEVSIVKIQKGDYGLVTIPAGVWYSFKSMDDRAALIVNLIDDIHASTTKKMLPIDTTEIPFDWYANA